MNTHVHSNEEIKELGKNPYVLKCSWKTITYTYDFKMRALELHKQGVSSREIFRRFGFDISSWNKDYPRHCIKGWKKIVKKSGYEGLDESSGTKATGRPKTKGVTDSDKIKRLELQVKYLEAENAFLTKLRAKRAESNSGQMRNSKSSNK